MPRSPKSKESVRKSRSFYSVHPWQCRHHEDHSEIIAYVEASGNWETVAEVRHTSGVDAETIASFMVCLINENQKAKKSVA